MNAQVDHLECLCWLVGLTSVVLAPFTSALHLLLVTHYDGPIEPLLEGTPHKTSRGRVVSVDPLVDVLQELLSSLDRNAVLLHPYMPSLVQVFTNEDKGLGSFMEPSFLCLVFEERATE